MRQRLRIGWKVGFWLGACAIAILLLWLFSAVLLPFVVAMVIGYLLDPLVNKLERFKIGRAVSATIILVGSLVLVVVALVLFAPMLGRQIAALVKELPGLVGKAQWLVATLGEQMSHGWLHTMLAKVGLGDTGVVNDLKSNTSDLVNRAANWLIGFANSLWTRSAALLDLASLVVITPVVAFYMLVDWRKLVTTIDNLIPPRDRPTVRSLAAEIDRALAGFLRGQSLVCLFLAAWYGIGLSLIGLSFGLLIGIVGGLLSFVPYVGSLFVFVLAMFVAVIQGWPSWHLPAMALGVVLIGQFLEGNVLSPKLVGDKVGLHPVWLIFALLGAGSVFGFTGLIAAVPVASAIGVLLRFATCRYKESPIYTGHVRVEGAPSLPKETAQPALAQPQMPLVAPVEPVLPRNPA